MDQAWKSIKTLLLASISWKDLILHGNQKKENEKVNLENCQSP